MREGVQLSNDDLPLEVAQQVRPDPDDGTVGQRHEDQLVLARAVGLRGGGGGGGTLAVQLELARRGSKVELLRHGLDVEHAQPARHGALLGQVVQALLVYDDVKVEAIRRSRGGKVAAVERRVAAVGAVVRRDGPECGLHLGSGVVERHAARHLVELQATRRLGAVELAEQQPDHLLLGLAALRTAAEPAQRRLHHVSPHRVRAKLVLRGAPLQHEDVDLLWQQRQPRRDLHRGRNRDAVPLGGRHAAAQQVDALDARDSRHQRRLRRRQVGEVRRHWEEVLRVVGDGVARGAEVARGARLPARVGRRLELRDARLLGLLGPLRAAGLAAGAEAAVGGVEHLGGEGGELAAARLGLGLGFWRGGGGAFGL